MSGIFLHAWAKTRSSATFEFEKKDVSSICIDSRYNRELIYTWSNISLKLAIPPPIRFLNNIRSLDCMERTQVLIHGRFDGIVRALPESPEKLRLMRNHMHGF